MKNDNEVMPFIIVCYATMKTYVKERVVDEVLFKSFIRFFHVHFDSHIAFFVPGSFVEVIKIFKGCHCVVTNNSFLDKSTLILIDNTIENKFDSASNSFGNDLYDDIQGRL